MNKFILATTLLIPCLATNQLSAKDLFVSTTGDNNVSYSDNSITQPWRTIAHGVYNVKAGDSLHIREGSYTPNYPMLVKSDYARKTYGGDPAEIMNAETGTELTPVHISNYQQEEVNINLANVSTFLQLDGKSYWNISGLNFTNVAKVFAVGTSLPSTNNSFNNMNIQMNRGGDNSAAFQLINANAEYTSISNNTIVGPGTDDSIHLNTAGIYLKSIKNVTILNNDISNAPIGIYYKHKTIYSDAGEVNIEIAYNHIHNTSRNSMNLNSDHAHIHNNIIGSNSAGISLNNANGAPGGDHNKFEHNTFFGGGLSLNHNTQSGDLTPGAIGNQMARNIFHSNPIKIHEYSDLSHNTSLDNNLYPSTTVIRSNRINYTLSSWISHHKQDDNSHSGQAVFQGGSAPGSIAGYALSSQSPGYKAAVDGSNLGANVTMVGPLSINTPHPPSDLSIQQQ